MKKSICFFLASIIIATFFQSCKNSNEVLSSGPIVKRKHLKGYYVDFISRQKKFASCSAQTDEKPKVDKYAVSGSGEEKNTENSVFSKLAPPANDAAELFASKNPHTGVMQNTFFKQVKSGHMKSLDYFTDKKHFQLFSNNRNKIVPLVLLKKNSVSHPISESNNLAQNIPQKELIMMIAGGGLSLTGLIILVLANPWSSLYFLSLLFGFSFLLGGSALFVVGLLFFLKK